MSKAEQFTMKLSISEALPYLPSDIITPDGSQRLSPTVSCSFGPVGRQVRSDMSMFDFRKNCKSEIIQVSWPRSVNNRNTSQQSSFQKAKRIYSTQELLYGV